MFVVGLTGPMGAGKSVVLGVFRELGAICLRADDASRELLSSDMRLLSEIRECFGDGVFRADGSLDRRRLAEVIFHDPAQRRRLEQITHPPMVSWLRDRLGELDRLAEPPRVVVIEAAILSHMGARGLVDVTVRVHAPLDECLKRIQERDRITPEQARARLALHEQLGLFAEDADYVLDTSGTEEQTRDRARALWSALLAASQASGP
ncbi:MAG: dephospho-CoA kinase [Acidobacteriota bacterium]|nr:dephospho-CoA kinase [Acidobacteriota bacterium]